MKKLIFFLPFILNAQIIDTVITLPDKPENILFIPAGNELYINCCYRENRFIVLDCSTYTIKKIIRLPADYPSAAFGVLNWKRNKIYYTFENAPDSIAVIDNQTDSIIKWINYESYWTPCYNSQDDKVYATNGGTLAVIDCNADSIIKIIPPQNYYFGHFTMWDSIGNKVYCGSGASDKIIVVDCLTDSIVKIISTGLGSPHNFVYNLERRKLYVGGYWGRGCAVVDADRDTLIKYYNIDYYPDIAPVWNRTEDKVYWYGYETLYVINCQNDSIIKDNYYIVGDMGFANWSNHLYITRDTWVSQPQCLLKVLDCHHDSLITQMWIGLAVIGISANPQDQRIYIATQYDSSIYVIRDEIPGIEERTMLEAKRFMPEIYPNPVKGVLRVRCSLGEKAIKIFNASGRLIKEIATPLARNNEVMEISLKGISPGIYFIRMGKQTKKFLVVK